MVVAAILHALTSPCRPPQPLHGIESTVLREVLALKLSRMSYVAQQIPHIVKPFVLLSCALCRLPCYISAVVGDVFCLLFRVQGQGVGGGVRGGGGLYNNVLFPNNIWSTQAKVKASSLKPLTQS